MTPPRPRLVKADEVPPKLTIPMGQRKSGLAVPAEAVDQCRHTEVIQRIKPQMNQFVCHDCGEKVFMVVLQFVVVNQEQFAELQAAQARMVAAQEHQRRQKETGLTIPGR